MSTRFVCEDCGTVLTGEERRWYTYQCEGCVQEWSDKMSKWMKGADFPELDAQYAKPARRLQ